MSQDSASLADPRCYFIPQRPPLEIESNLAACRCKSMKCAICYLGFVNDIDHMKVEVRESSRSADIQRSRTAWPYSGPEKRVQFIIQYVHIVCLRNA